MKKIGLVAASLATLLLSGCGDDAAKSPPVAPPSAHPAASAPAVPASIPVSATSTPAIPAPVAAPPVTPAAPTAAKEAFPKDKATGTVSGTVKVEGKAKAPKAIDTSSDKFCAEAHKDAPAMKEELIVNAENQGIQNVFVYVKSANVSAWSYDVPAEAVKIDQVGCVYTPHVVGVMTKQDIEITSKDATTHNVHFISKGVLDSENFTQTQNQSNKVNFKKPEMGDYFKCDIHGWMQCHVHVMDHPFFAVTDKDGKFTLPKLPAGEYEFAALHEKLGETSIKKTVEDGKELSLDFTLKAK